MLSFVGKLCFSQEPYHYFHSVEPHIAPGHINKKIIEDEAGYLYFLYRDKVIKYNGIEFRDLSLLDKNRAIPWHTIQDISILNDGTLLLSGILNKVYAINETFQFEVEINPNIKGIYHSIYNVDGNVVLLSDESVDLYVYSSQQKLERSKSWAIDKPRQLITFEDQVFISAGDGVYRISMEDDSTILLDIPHGELYLDHNQELKLLDAANMLWTIGDRIILDSWQPFQHIKHKLKLAFTFEGDIWATMLGRATYYASNSVKARLINNENSSLISPSFMRPPFCDKFGTLWIASERLYYKPLSHGFRSLKLNKDKKVINSVYEDDLYIMHTVQDGGLYVFDKVLNETRYLTAQNSKLGGGSRIIVSGLSGGKYAINYFGGVQLFDGQNLSEPIKLNGTSRDFEEFESGYVTSDFRNIYFLDLNFKITKSFKLKKLIPSHGRIVNKIIKLGKNEGYAFTNSGKILALNLLQNRCEVLKEESDISNFYKKSASVITATLDYLDTTIIIASTAGLYRYNLKNKSLQDSIRIPSTLKSIELFKGEIWISCQNGLYTYNEDLQEWKHYTEGYGLINKTYDIRDSYVYKDSIMLVGGYNGIDIVDNPNENKTVRPSLSIRSIQEFPSNNWISNTENSTYNISPNTDKIEIKVDGIHTGFGQDLIIEYRHDSESKWQKLTNGILNIIDPKIGTVSFTFRARLPNGITSGNKVVMLEVEPLWHQSIWVRCLFMFCLMSAIGYIVFWWQKSRYNQALIEEKLQHEVLTYKLQSVNSQMNPHFVFNVMSGIQQLILANENKTAMRYLNTFSRLLRHVVNYSSKNFVPISEEITFIQHYMNLEKMRFEDKFDYKIINDLPSNQEVLVPTFVIQPLLENSIKHGVKSLKNRGVISLLIFMDEANIIIEVKDNGLGIESSDVNDMFNPNQPHGLQLIKNKLNHITPVYGQATICLNQGNPGTVTRIKLPIILNEK